MTYFKPVTVKDRRRGLSSKLVFFVLLVKKFVCNRAVGVIRVSLLPLLSGEQDGALFQEERVALLARNGGARRVFGRAPLVRRAPRARARVRARVRARARARARRAAPPAPSTCPRTNIRLSCKKVTSLKLFTLRYVIKNYTLAFQFDP